MLHVAGRLGCPGGPGQGRPSQWPGVALPAEPRWSAAAGCCRHVAGLAPAVENVGRSSRILRCEGCSSCTTGGGKQWELPEFGDADDEL